MNNNDSIFDINKGPQTQQSTQQFKSDYEAQRYIKPQQDALQLNNLHLEVFGAGQLAGIPMEPTSTVNITEQGLRQAFIRKVLACVFCMLLVSLIFCAITARSQKLQKFMNDHIWLVLLLFVIEILLIVVIACFKILAKRVPYNYITLVGFLFCQTYVLGFLVAQYTPHSILVALVVCSSMVLFFGIYAWKTKTDITYKFAMLGYLPLIIICFILFGVQFRSEFLNMVWSLLISLFFCMFLVYDLQKIKGAFLVEYTIDDYLIAALSLYVDIVLIFQYILVAFGASQNSQRV